MFVKDCHSDIMEARHVIACDAASSTPQPAGTTLPLHNGTPQHPAHQTPNIPATTPDSLPHHPAQLKDQPLMLAAPCTGVSTGSACMRMHAN